LHGAVHPTLLSRQLLALLRTAAQAEQVESTQSIATVELAATENGVHISLTETQKVHVVVDKRSGRYDPNLGLQAACWYTHDDEPSRNVGSLRVGLCVVGWCSFVAEGDVSAALLRELEQCVNSAVPTPVTVNVFARLRCAFPDRCLAP
jgi:hypothetical protein